MHLLDEADRVALEAFFEWRGSDMRAGKLPFEGGTLEQPAALMAAFRAMNVVFEALQRQDREQNA